MNLFFADLSEDVKEGEGENQPPQSLNRCFEVLTLTFLRTLRRARVAKAVAVLSSLPRAMYLK